MQYDLQRMGPQGFQDLVGALAIRALGAHVRPMGTGKDGGRDLLVEGRLVWSPPDVHPAEVWDGRTVFQVKHRATLLGPQQDFAWVWHEIKKELQAWSSPDSKRDQVPRYLAFCTNVPLTPVHYSGGFDRLDSHIRGYITGLSDETSEDHLQGPDRMRARSGRRARRDRMRNLQEWRFWDGYHIEGLLNAYAEVRRGSNGLLTAGDVLADLSELTTTVSTTELGPTLRGHARWALIDQRNVYFDDAGGDTRGVPVEQVAIDLPVTVPGSDAQERVMRYVLARGEHLLAPTLSILAKPRHIVITGPPGNGKTTVSKFLVQAYRSRLVSESSDLAEQHQTVVSGTTKRLEQMGIPPLGHRRWPMRVDLAKFAKRKATDENYTLLNWIADTLSAQASTKAVPRWGLASWLKLWPSFLVLDGLDEVTEPTVRKGLIANIDSFVAEAEAEDYDTLIVVTTRPTGYADEMASDTFERINLADLSVGDALEYGRVVTRLRVPDDSARREGIEALLRSAASDDALRHLLRTPLQVLIMSIIAESSRQFSPSRFSLFWGYYQVVAAREQNKTLGFSNLLRDHAPQVLTLHRRVGLILQARAERSGGETAALTFEELRDVAWEVLAQDDYQPSSIDAGLLSQIVTAATQRLVLIAPRGDSGYGFDIRSLQELMAALEITTGTLQDSTKRLRRIAASPHWRNTWLFAAGRYFAEPQAVQHQAITELLLSIDDDAAERLSAVCPVGPTLALEMIDDGMTASLPRYQYQLLRHGLRTLTQFPPRRITPIAWSIQRAAATSHTCHEIVRDSLRDALGGTETQRALVASLQMVLAKIGSDQNLKGDLSGLAVVNRDATVSIRPSPRADWVSFDETVGLYSTDETRAILSAASASIRAIAEDGAPLDLNVWAQVASSDEVIQVLNEALPAITLAEPAVVAALRDYVIANVWRKPVRLDDLLST